MVKRTAGPLSIDGQLDDTAWPLPNSIARPNSGSNDNTATFGVLWDDTYLYVGVKVLDAKLYQDSTETWQNDGVEIYVDGAGEGSPTYDGNDRQFTKGWSNPILLTAQSGAGVLHGVANIAGGYTVALGIPWSNLGVVPRVDMTLGFDVQQNDDDDGGGRDGTVSWNATRDDINFKSTVEFGRLTLSAEVLSGAGGGGGSGTSHIWEPFPIRTKAQQTAGLAGGEGGQWIHSFVFAQNNPNTVYLGASNSRVWKSTDGGSSWHPKWRGMLSFGVPSLAIDPANDNNLLAAGSTMGAWRNTREGIYRTTNGGESWQFVKMTTFSNPWFRGGWGGELVAYGRNGVAYAGPDGEGLLKSTDGGLTWNVVRAVGAGAVLSGTRIHDVKVHPTNDAITYVCNPSGLHQIVDAVGGATVTRIGLGLPSAPHVTVIDKRTPNVLYVALKAVGGGVHKSTDGGATFSPRNTGLAPALDAPAEYLVISPSDPDYLYVTFSKWGNHVYYTRNGGASWSAATSMDEQNADGWVAGSSFGITSESGVDFNPPIAVHPTNKSVALTTGPLDSSQIKKTTDGGVNWRYSSSGYLGMSYGSWPIASSNAPIGWDQNDANRALYCFGGFGPRLTTNGGSTFTFPKPPAVNGHSACMAAAIDPTPGSNVMIIASGAVAPPHQRLLRTTDGGVTWAETGGTDDDYRFIAFHPQSPNIVYATGNASRISTDSGLTWTRLPRRVSTLYAGDGNIVYSIGRGAADALLIYKSTDRGATWPAAALASVPTPSDAQVGQIVVSPNNPDRLYLAARPYGVYIVDGASVVLKNEAHGLIKGDLGFVGIYVLAVDPRRPNVIYGGSMPGGLTLGNGVFRSTDFGESWTNVTGNLGPDLSIVSLSVNPHNGALHMSSFAGNWRLAPP